MALTGDLTKDGILAMEQVYLPRILALEVALMTACFSIETYVETMSEDEIKEKESKHLDLLIKSLNDKEYLSRVFNEDMKRKLNMITFLPYKETK